MPSCICEVYTTTCVNIMKDNYKNIILRSLKNLLEKVRKKTFVIMINPQPKLHIPIKAVWVESCSHCQLGTMPLGLHDLEAFRLGFASVSKSTKTIVLGS